MIARCTVCGSLATIHANGIAGCDEHAHDVFKLAVTIEALEKDAPIDDVERVVAEMMTDLRNRRDS